MIHRDEARAMAEEVLERFLDDLEEEFEYTLTIIEQEIVKAIKERCFSMTTSVTLSDYEIEHLSELLTQRFGYKVEYVVDPRVWEYKDLISGFWFRGWKITLSW